MNSTKTIASAAIAGLIALGMTGASFAQTGPAAKPGYDFEKCFGVAKAGKNDCQTANSSCAGTSALDGQKDAWVFLPKGTCEKLLGGEKMT